MEATALETEHFDTPSPAVDFTHAILELDLCELALVGGGETFVQIA